MTDFIFILIAAAAAHGIAFLLRLPAIPVYLLAGAGTRALMGGESNNDIWIYAVELGLVFLVFSVGVELNPKRINKQLKSVWMVGLVQFGALGLSGFAIAHWLGYSMIEAVYITFALSASSTLVVIRLLKQRQQMFEPFGRLVSGVLLLQDVFIIVILVLLLRVDQGIGAMLLGLAQTAAIGGVAWIGHRWLAYWMVIKVKQDEETLLLTILSVLFVFLGIAWALELPLAVGAFMGGFVLSVFPVNGVTRGMLSSLSGFFVAMFFTTLGALLVWPEPQMWTHAVILGLFLILITVPLVTFIAEYTGISAKSAIESGLLLSQTSEFSLILVLQGWILMQISHELFSMLALLTVGTMAITPFLSHERVAHFLMRWHPLIGGKWQIPDSTENHVLILGYGSAGDDVATPIHESGTNVVVVDDDAAVVRRLNRLGMYAIRGEASSPSVLRKVCAVKAQLVIIAVRRISDAEKILNALHDCQGEIWVRVFDASQAKIAERHGATAIVGANQAVEKFQQWIRREHPLGEKSGQTES